MSEEDVIREALDKLRYHQLASDDAIVEPALAALAALLAEREEREKALRALEAELRDYVADCCAGREQFCESYGCSTIERIADRLDAITQPADQRSRREA